MRKITLALMIISVAACLCCQSCSPKMHENLMAPANAPMAATTNTPTMVPFTKAKKQQLENNKADLTQLQFYIDQELILRRMSGGGNEMIKGGAIVRENSHTSNEIVIPALTPVVCDRVAGDSLMISFETQNNDIPFGALYGSNTFSVLGTNWINGSADVTYNNQTYRIICGSCSNVAEVKLMVKETSIDRGKSANKTITGRKLYK